MINIHTDLLKSVAEKIIDADDFFILLCLGKRIGKNNDSWPSVARLMSESNFGKNKVHTCISNLVKAGFIEKEQRRVEKKGTKQTVLSTNL